VQVLLLVSITFVVINITSFVGTTWSSTSCTLHRHCCDDYVKDELDEVSRHITCKGG